jgi:hypothetical protein
MIGFEICATQNRLVDSAKVIIPNLALAFQTHNKTRESEEFVLTGIRTELNSCSDIHCQSCSVIHVSQWCSSISRALMPCATSRSLCAGDVANWNGVSAIQRSSTNQDPRIEMLQFMYRADMQGRYSANLSSPLVVSCNDTHLVR